MASLTTTLANVGKSALSRGTFRYPTIIRTPQPAPLGAALNFGAKFQNPNLVGMLGNPKNTALPSADFTTSFDYDPVLANISAMATMHAEQARAAANNLKRQIFINAGSPELAREYGADEGTILAAQNNPFGTIQLLSKDANKRNRDLNQSFNESNLFYSGARALGLEDQAFGVAGSQSGFANKLRELIARIDRAVKDAEERDRAATAPGPAPAPAPAPAPIPTGPPMPPLGGGGIPPGASDLGGSLIGGIAEGGVPGLPPITPPGYDPLSDPYNPGRPPAPQPLPAIPPGVSDLGAALIGGPPPPPPAGFNPADPYGYGGVGLSPEEIAAIQGGQYGAVGPAPAPITPAPPSPTEDPYQYGDIYGALAAPPPVAPPPPPPTDWWTPPTGYYDYALNEWVPY